MQATQSVIRNFLALASGEATSRLIAFGTTIYLARVLGATHFGVIAFALGITLYLMRIADFAIEAVGSKEIAENPQNLEKIASSVLIARLQLTTMLVLVSAACAFQLFTDPERTILLLYFLILFPIAGNAKWIFLGIEYAKPIGLSRVLGELISLSIVLVYVKGSEHLWVVPLAQLASESFVCIVLFIALRLRGIKLRLKSDRRISTPILKRAFPVLIQYLLGLVIYNSDLIFIRIFSTPDSIGYYAVAYTLISFLSNLGLVYGLSLIPTITRVGSRTHAELNLYHTALAQTFAVTLPVTCGGYLLAGQIIELGFGPAYQESIVVLQILICSIPLSIFRNTPWAALVARGKQSLLLKASVYAVIVNLVLNTVLVMKYGMVGAAIATVATESIAGLLLLKYAHNEGLPFVSLRRLWRPIIASGSMVAFLVYVPNSNIFINVAGGGLVFAITILLVGGVRFHRGQRPTLNI